MFETETLMWLIPALPLAAALSIAVAGKWLGENSRWPLIVGTGLSFVLSLMLLMRVYDASLPWIPDLAAAAEGHEESHGEAAPAEPAERKVSDGPVGVGYEKILTLWRWSTIPQAHEPNLNAPERGKVQDDAVKEARPFDLALDVSLRADALTSVMLVVVTFVSTLVVIYAGGYMHGDPGFWRFFVYLGLFVFSMTMLVSSSNFMLLYVFWEAVGACSYLLIGYWYTKPSAAAAGMKAFLVNRVGDVGLAIAVFLIWINYGTLNFHDTHPEPGEQLTVASQGVLGQMRLSSARGNMAGGETVTMAICLCLMLAACGKSAQFPLHVWLPDAMEGPTPVSALMHAATMVTAGVYLVTRCTPFFAVSETARLVVASIGGFTALLAGLIALTQTDLKRVLAYSTVSQLGYMFLGLGVGTAAGITAGMFHLFTHAFFKACLFLGAGSVMHAMGGVIDMTRFGGLRKLMPYTHWTFLAGALALAGVPPLAGFWSKDAILGSAHDLVHLGGPRAAAYETLYYMGVFTALLTAFYTFRAYFLTFCGEERIPKEAGHHAHESPMNMAGPLVVLAVAAVVVGGLFHTSLPAFLLATPSLAIERLKTTAQPGVFHADVALISSIIALIGVGAAAYLYLGDRRQLNAMAAILQPFRGVSYNKFYIDEIYQGVIVWPLELIAQVSAWIDRNIVDATVNFVGRIPGWSGVMIRGAGNGLVQFYGLAMAVGILVLVGLLMAG